ncbi:MAG TPA: (d)CMP kinase, partial [Candidatus Brocadiales bacterium]|nr:(d)CMP kinase [Candidatus Brocadiales bacterium]
MIVAIDGPAASGKSTVAKRLAKRLGFKYLDTGALYRALTLKAIESQIDLQDESALGLLMDNTCLELQSVTDDEVKVLLDGRDVSKEIRRTIVTNLVHHIAGSPSVREKMVRLQRKIAYGGNTVAEGRDIGTIVFPDADKKFYLDADVQERAKRRFAELKSNENVSGEITVAQVSAELNQRDYKDIKRAVSPLRRADDAVYIDTTNLTVEEVVKTLLRQIQSS